MTKPMLLAEFTRLPPAIRAAALDGLSGAIDAVAASAPETHRFLRYQWFAAAIAAYGGAARTILVEAEDVPVIALPMIGYGPTAARLAMVPGGTWPFRGFPTSVEAGEAAFSALIDRLGQETNALRIGPICEDDPALTPLLAMAQARGWVALERTAVREGSHDEMSAQDGFWSRAINDPVIAAALPARDSDTNGAIREWLLLRPGLPAMIGRALRPIWERGGR